MSDEKKWWETEVGAELLADAQEFVRTRQVAIIMRWPSELRPMLEEVIAALEAKAKEQTSNE